MIKIKKQIGLITILIIFLLTLSSIASAALIQTAGNSISATFVNQEPDPVEPGKYITVKFKISNEGSKNTDDITVTLNPKFPFTLPAGEDAKQKIGMLEAAQYGSKSQVLSWKLLVDKDAPEGDNYLSLRIDEKGNPSSIIYDDSFTINIRTSDNVISVTQISTEPKIIKPGESAKLKIKLKNLADSPVKDIKTTLNLNGLSISTLNSINEQIIQKLNSKEEIELKFTIIPDADAVVAIHKIPLNIEFKDNLNNAYSQNTSFGLKISSPIEYLVYVDSTDLTKIQSKGEVSIKIANSGVNNIKFLTAELINNPQYEILSTPKLYIGKVDSDDYEDMSFNIYVNNVDSQGNVKLKLKLKFKDNLNQEYLEDKSINLKLFSEAKIKKYGLNGKSKGNGWLITLAIVILGGGIYWYMKRKKKSKKK